MASYKFQPGLPFGVLTPKDLSIEDVRSRARDFSSAIHSDWTKLSAILKRFEGIVHKRWGKKTQKQREELLLKAWPDMAPTHLPDFAAMRQMGKLLDGVKQVQPTSPAALLWPYINLEDLKDRISLLHLLRSRSRSFPEVFAAADLEAIHLADDWDMMNEPNEFMMTLQGCRSPYTYGDVIHQRGYRRPATSAGMSQHAILVMPKQYGRRHTRHLSIIHHPSIGLFILEVQHKLYSFLTSCTRAILHDIDPRQFYIAPHCEPPTFPDPTDSDWPSLAAYKRQMPYMTPQKMDLERLKTLINAQKSIAEDHLWMLRDDPGYFIDTLKEQKEHHGVAREPCNHNTWRAMVALMLADAFVWCLRWNYIANLLNSMPPMDVQLREADSDGLRLPAQPERAWAELQHMVFVMVPMALARLAQSFEHSPWLRRNTVPYGEKLVITPSTLQKFSAAERRVYNLFVYMGDNCEIHILSRLLQESQYMFETDVHAKQLVDAWMISQLANLAMMQEIHDRITALYPWSYGWKIGQVLQSPKVQDNIKKFWAVEERVRMTIEVASAAGAFDSLGDPKGSEWYYPVSNKKTQPTVEKLQRAEAKLDLLWDDLRTSALRVGKICLFEVMSDQMQSPRELNRTAAWEEARIKPAETISITNVNKDIPLFPNTDQDTRVQVHAEQKIKPKTRGVANLSAEQSYQHAAALTTTPNEASKATPSPKIKVPKRAYATLSALFPSLGADNHQRKEIEWDELLQALNAIGLQPEKLYGSVWLFEPKAKEECLVEMNRSIQFHEPKEVRKGSKIPAGMVRVYGRRLKHAYGWENGMFVSE